MSASSMSRRVSGFARFNHKWFKSYTLTRSFSVNENQCQNCTQLPLTQVHADFLSRVSKQGDGSITAKTYNGVTVISITNVAKRNALSGKMMADLAKIVDAIVPSTPTLTEPAPTCLILTGTGSEAFCAGADFSLVKNIVNTKEMGVMMSLFMRDALNRLRQSSLVSVCVINGSALGGGAELTTTCDFRIMRKTSDCDAQKQQQPFIQFVHAKIGASPGWGGARRLTHIVGRKNALILGAASQPVSADIAHSMGLVDEVFTNDCRDNQDSENIAAGIRFLQPYLAQPYWQSVGAIKKAIASVENEDTTQSMKTELQMFNERWFSPENISALKGKK